MQKQLEEDWLNEKHHINQYHSDVTDVISPVFTLG